METNISRSTPYGSGIPHVSFKITNIPQCVIDINDVSFIQLEIIEFPLSIHRGYGVKWFGMCDKFHTSNDVNFMLVLLFPQSGCWPLIVVSNSECRMSISYTINTFHISIGSLIPKSDLVFLDELQSFIWRKMSLNELGMIYKLWRLHDTAVILVLAVHKKQWFARYY